MSSQKLTKRSNLYEKQKCDFDEAFDRASTARSLCRNEDLLKEIESLNLDVPHEVMQRIESDIEQSENQPKISVNGLNKALMSVAPEYRGRMRLSVILPALVRFLVSPPISLVLTLPAGL